LKSSGVDGKNARPTHRDEAAMNWAQIYLPAKLRRVAGSVSGPPACSYQSRIVVTDSRTFERILSELSLSLVSGLARHFILYAGPEWHVRSQLAQP
jgi:hypothetical protein